MNRLVGTSFRRLQPQGSGLPSPSPREAPSFADSLLAGDAQPPDEDPVETRYRLYALRAQTRALRPGDEFQASSEIAVREAQMMVERWQMGARPASCLFNAVMDDGTMLPSTRFMLAGIIAARHFQTLLRDYESDARIPLDAEHDDRYALGGCNHNAHSNTLTIEGEDGICLDGLDLSPAMPHCETWTWKTSLTTAPVRLLHAPSQRHITVCLGQELIMHVPLDNPIPALSRLFKSV